MYILVLVISLTSLFYGYAYNDNYVELLVYRDGLVHVTQRLKCNETYPTITIKLLSTKVENVLALDENNTLLDYEIVDTSMKIYSLGAKEIVVEYDTFELTSMEAGVWTLSFNSPYNLTVKLPEGATIIYLSSVPTVITSEANRTVLYLSSGAWEISYILPAIPFKPDTSGPSEAPPEEVKPRYPVELMIVGILAALIVVSGAFIIHKRKRSIDIESIFREHPELNDDERVVLKFIASRGGRIFEAKLRKAFPEIPRTTLWRMVKRLEKLGILHVKKVGIQNQVELSRK